MKITKLAYTGSLLIVGLGLAANGYSQAFLTNGLVAYYPFNGNANDASGSGHNGTVYGATLTTDRFGNPNGAYYFDGSSAYITAPLSNTVFGGDFTVSIWFDAFDIANPWPILLHEQNTSFLLQLVGTTCGCSGIGHMIAYGYEGQADIMSWSLKSSQQMPLNTHCQVVVTRAGTNVAMYLNSQITGAGQVANLSTQPGSYLTIGREDVAVFPQPAYTTFHGVIDDVRIYKRAFSSNEVQQLYAIESGPRVDLIKAVKPSFTGSHSHEELPATGFWRHENLDKSRLPIHGNQHQHDLPAVF